MEFWLRSGRFHGKLLVVVFVESLQCVTVVRHNLEERFVFSDGKRSVRLDGSPQQLYHLADVAELYGVEKKRVNEAVSNNPEKFPEGYVWGLNGAEKNEVVENFDHLHKLKFSPQLPKAFTEKGLYMLATILKSPKAVETTIAIVETYAKLRELSRVMAAIPQQEENSVEQKTLLQRGGQLVEDLMTDTLPVQSSETSFELNLAMLKFKHSVKRGADEERIVRLEEENAELKRRLGGTPLQQP